MLVHKHVSYTKKEATLRGIFMQFLYSRSHTSKVFFIEYSCNLCIGHNVGVKTKNVSLYVCVRLMRLQEACEHVYVIDICVKTCEWTFSFWLYALSFSTSIIDFLSLISTLSARNSLPKKLWTMKLLLFLYIDSEVATVM